MYAPEITIDRSKATLIFVNAAIPGIWFLYGVCEGGIGEPGRPGSRLIGLLLFPVRPKYEVYIEVTVHLASC